MLQGVLTPNASTISSSLIPFKDNPDSLLTQAQQLNSQLNSWIRNDWNNDNINIVICDWFQLANYVDVVVSLNDLTRRDDVIRLLNGVDPAAALARALETHSRINPANSQEVQTKLKSTANAPEPAE